MGNTNSNSLDFEYNIATADYTTVRKLHDYLIGDFYEVKSNNTQELLLLKARTTDDITKYQQIIENSYQRLALSHKNLAKVHGYAGREEKKSAKPQYKLYIYFQPLPRDLAKAMKTRKNIFASGLKGHTSVKYIPEPELYSIMIQLVDVMEYLQVKGISHGDIRPEACFIQDDGNLVICDRRLIYDEEWDFVTPEKGHEKNLLLSPLAFQAFVKKENNTKEDKHKGDVFSSGMTLLECATYKRSAHIYEWTTPPTINKDLVYRRLGEVQERYSPKLTQIIMEMLRFEEHLRPDFITLKKWIMGTEPLATIGHHFSHQKKADHGPQLSRNSIGPKLISGSPTSKGGVKPFKVDNGRVPMKVLLKDDGPLETIADELEHGKYSNTGCMEKDDEEEIVEFETEETPKRTISAETTPKQSPAYSPTTTKSQYTYETTTYRPSVESNSSYLHTNPTTTITPSLFNTHNIYHQSITHGGHNLLPYVQLTTVNSDPAYRNYNSDIRSPVSSEYIKNQAQETVKKASNFACSPLDIPYNYKGSFSSGQGYGSEDSNALRITAANTSEANSASKIRSPGFDLNSPYRGYESPLSFGDARTSFLSQHEAHSGTKTPLESLYVNQQNEERLRSLEQYRASLIAKHQTIQERPHSPAYSQSEHEHTVYSPNKSINNHERLDSSLTIEPSGNPEQWRSVIGDGYTYNSVLSATPDSPRMSNPSMDLLSQTLHSLAPSKSHTPYRPASRTRLDQGIRSPAEPGYGGQGVLNIPFSADDRGDFGSLGGTTPQFKNYIKSGFSKPTSINSLDLNGLHTPVSSLPNSSRMVDNQQYNPRADVQTTDVNDLFKKAMERSKQTIELLKEKNQLGPSMNGDLWPSRSISEQVAREPVTSAYRKY